MSDFGSSIKNKKGNSGKKAGNKIKNSMNGNKNKKKITVRIKKK